MKNDNKLKVNTYDISMVVDSGYNIPVVTFYSISLWSIFRIVYALDIEIWQML